MISSLERSLVYPAPPRKRGAWKTRWLDKQDVYFQSQGPGRESARLHGWFVPHPEQRHVVLYAHGQTEHVANLVGVVARLQETMKASVLVFDYRGYGKSQGHPTEAGCIADGLAAQQWLAERTGVLPEDIVLVGRSLGGAVAVAAAVERGAKALVLEATFSRLTDVAAYKYPWAPVRQLMTQRFDSVARIRRYHGPLMQLHGTRDRVAPAKFARELFAACPSELKRFYVFRGGKHGDAAPLAFYSKLDAFLGEIDATRPGFRLPAAG